jgi:hypothetical protein
MRRPGGTARHTPEGVAGTRRARAGAAAHRAPPGRPEGAGGGGRGGRARELPWPRREQAGRALPGAPCRAASLQSPAGRPHERPRRRRRPSAPGPIGSWAATGLSRSSAAIFSSKLPPCPGAGRCEDVGVRGRASGAAAPGPRCPRGDEGVRVIPLGQQGHPGGGSAASRGPASRSTAGQSRLVSVQQEEELAGLGPGASTLRWPGVRAVEHSATAWRHPSWCRAMQSK